MIIQNNFPNVIVFHHSDADGITAAFITKLKYDNNLINSSWERNVTCIPCSYGESFNLDFFKEKVNEHYVENQQNIVYMLDYCIQPNEYIVNFWNWLSDKNIQFFWIDHHITAIENLKHLNIPGLQHSAFSGCLNTWHCLNGNENPPMILRFVNDFDIWNKNSEYSWEKQLYPLICFFDAMGSDLNDNTGELVSALKAMFEDNNQTNKFINIGKYIYKYVKNKYQHDTKRIYQAKWNNYNCLLLNSSFKGSDQFNDYENVNDFDLLIVYTFNGKIYTYSIYSKNPKINCGEICKNFLNGGGHKGAAGGYSEKFIL